MKYYVDFAAQSGFPYMMLDAGWSAGRDITHMNGKIDVPELVRYAATKNVKVWIWCYSESVAQQMQEAFPLFEKWGVAGRENRLRQSRRSAGHPVVLRCREAGRRASPHGRLSRHAHALGAGAHLSQRAQLRRRAGHGEQQGGPPRQPGRSQRLPFHAPAGRPHGLHAWRLQQRHGRWLRRAEHAAPW